LIAGPQRQFLLDTNIFLHFARFDELSRQIRDRYTLFSGETQPLTCLVSVGEIRSLALQLNWGANRLLGLAALLKSVGIVSLDQDGLVDAYSEMDDYSRRNGRPRGQNDLWIAAAARVTGATLLTTDRDFDHLHALFIEREWINPERDPRE
jgi:tRNA(fMet)-specific endonuclease VapC